MNVLLKFPDSASVNELEVRMIIASRLFEDGKLSSGQAASVVGITKQSFLELIGKFQVSVFGYNKADIEEELQDL